MVNWLRYVEKMKFVVVFLLKLQFENSYTSIPAQPEQVRDVAFLLVVVLYLIVAIEFQLGVLVFVCIVQVI